MLVDVCVNFIETSCKEEKSYPFNLVSLTRFTWDAGFKHTRFKQLISERPFLFLENVFGDAASGCMGKKDRDSDGGIKILETIKWTTFRLTIKNWLMVKIARNWGTKSVLKYPRRHINELFTKISISQSKRDTCILSER